MTKEHFGTTQDGKEVSLFSMRNHRGMECKITNYGGRIVSVRVPDRNGKLENVVLGFDSLDGYLRENPYFGAVVGRYANRIAGGKFFLDREKFWLAQNNAGNHLHGGNKGFDSVVWEAATDSALNSLRLTYVSPHMEEGYPGKLEVSVTYTLSEDNALDVTYEAATDQKTVVNLTQHSYFNLSGDAGSDILDHEVEIDADYFLPVDEELIPTGEFRKVENTAFDFRKAKPTGRDIGGEDPQLKRGSGYDHCWVLKEEDARKLAATAYHPESGRMLEVLTTEPGMQFYTGNHIASGVSELGKHYGDRSGLCFETQHYPDSPNRPSFPSVVLEPEDRYISKTAFRFSVRK